MRANRENGTDGLAMARRLRVRMRFVVNVHQLADGCVGVLLRRGKRLVAQELLNRAQSAPSASRCVANACRSECGCKSQLTLTSRTYFLTIRPTERCVSRRPA